MKSFLHKYPQLSLLCLSIAVAVAVCALGAPFALGITLVAATQLALLARSPRQAACFSVATLTPEQVKEFGDIMKSLEAHGEMFKQLKDLGGVEGGFAAIKALPNLLKGEQKRADELQATVAKLQKRSARTSALTKAGQVSDDCARHLGAIALAVGCKTGQINGRAADMAASQVKEILGAEIKSALTSSDIPLPTEYSGQVVELVGLYGMARKYGTVFPLGTGTVKLPKLTTDPTFGLIAGSATVTEKSPQVGFVTFTAEKFGGLVRIPTELEEDSIVPIGQFIARYAARNIARAEDYNFFASTGAGSGVNGSVEGLTTSTITNSKVTQMASTKVKYSDMTLAHLRALRAVPDAPVIRTGAYYFHPTFEQALAALNTSGDKPYNPNAQLANPDGAQPFINGPTLDGYPVRWVDVLPAYSTSSNASKVFALFGDLSFQYLGVRGGVRFDTSMDAGFTTDEILIRALERFTIGLMATGAVAGLETAAS